MMNIKETFTKLLLSISGKSNYVLYRNFLFTNSLITAKNDRVKFIRRKVSLPINLDSTNLEGEEFYLLLIHVDNIAHFFHDIFAVRDQDQRPAIAAERKEQIQNLVAGFRIQVRGRFVSKKK